MEYCTAKMNIKCSNSATTNWFERRNSVWEIIHQHESIPEGRNYDGEILTK